MDEGIRHFPDRMDAEAEAWVIREDRGLDAAGQRDLDDWLSLNPLHGARLESRRAEWGLFDAMQEFRDDPRWAMAAEPLPRRRRPLASLVAWASLPAAALLVLAFLHFGLLVRTKSAPIAAPELRGLTESAWLEDGSRAVLEPGSLVELQFSREERHLRLLRGAATFHVTKDPHRPFVVEVGELQFRALGTVFQVRRGGTEVELLVSEGRVRVDGTGAPGTEAPVLVAGERTRIAADRGTGALVRNRLSEGQAQAMDLSDSVCMEFNQTPLSEVAAILSARGPYAVRLADEAAGRVPVVASLRRDGAEALAMMLCAEGRLWYKKDGYTVVIGTASAESAPKP